MTFLCIFVGVFNVFNFTHLITHTEIALAQTGGGADAGQAGTPPPDAVPKVCLSDDCKSWSYIVFSWIVSGVGSLVGLIGYTLDYAIVNFIVGFGEKYKSSNLGETINSMWGLVRDIFNLTFIFGLVYIGFKMILDSGDSHIRKSLVSLIGAALLVNFSLFITKFIVDFSNIAAFKVYQAFQSADGSSTASISVAFANLLGMSSVFSFGPAQATANSSMLYLLGTLIVLLVLAYVYLAAAILITIRFVVLSIYLVFSPIMFLGWVFPSMGSATKKYWEGFLGQAFFAPAFLFMLYLSYRVVSRYNDGVSKHFNDGAYFDRGYYAQSDSLLPFFAMTIVFLIASMIVARKMSSQGSDSLMKITKYVDSKARVAIGAGSAGMAARAGRNSIGAGAYSLSQNDKFKDATARWGRAGKMVYNTTSKVGDSSFDARKVNGLGKTLGIGDGRKGGFASTIKEQKESDEKFLKAIGTRDADKFDAATKAAKEDWDKYEDLADNEKDLVKKAEYSALAKKAKENYNTAKSNYSAREEYSRQLAFAQSIENWQQMQRKLAVTVGGAAGVGVGILSGGAIPIAAGLTLGAASGYTLGTGTRFNNKQTSGALRKEYGTNGLKKRGESKKKHALEEAAAALGHGGGHDDHNKKEHKDEHGKEDKHAPTPSAPAKATSAPAGSHGGH